MVHPHHPFCNLRIFWSLSQEQDCCLRTIRGRTRDQCHLSGGRAFDESPRTVGNHSRDRFGSGLPLRSIVASVSVVCCLAVRSEGECYMRYKVRNIAALKVILGDLPDRTRVEVDRHIKLSAKTVGELRKMIDWPEVLAITTPREGSSESVVKGSRPSIATRTSRKQ